MSTMEFRLFPSTGQPEAVRAWNGRKNAHHLTMSERHISGCQPRHSESGREYPFSRFSSVHHKSPSHNRPDRDWIPAGQGLHHSDTGRNHMDRIPAPPRRASNSRSRGPRSRNHTSPRHISVLRDSWHHKDTRHPSRFLYSGFRARSELDIRFRTFLRNEWIFHRLWATRIRRCVCPSPSAL